jgi:hypothetical protein
MDQQQIENTIQFLVENQAKFHSDLELMKEAQRETTAQIQALAENTNAQIQALAENTNAQIQALTENVEAMRLETREAFDNLIIANESTRNFANEIAKLTVNISQRLTAVEQKTKDL